MTDRLLEEWGLSELKDLFAENCIDERALKLLTEEDIKELIPKIGLRVRFSQNWKMHFQKQEVVSFPVDLHWEDGSAASSSSILIDTSDTDSSTTFSPSQLSSQTSVPSSWSVPSESAQLSTQPPSKRQKTVLFDARDILNKTAVGRNVVRHISTEGFLSKRIRHDLVSILVAHLIETHGKNPCAFEKSALAQSIITAFPQLKDPQGITGYEAFYSKGASKCPASGYLEEHLRYVRKQLIQKATKEHVTESGGTTHMNSKRPLEMTDDVGDMIQWLKDNIEPAGQVQDYMRATAEYRREWIKDKNRTVAEIVSEFPRLLDEGMIDEEYKLLYPAHAHLLLDKWTSMQESIIAFGKQQCAVWRDALKLEEIDLQNLSQDEKTTLALYFLPLIFDGRKKAPLAVRRKESRQSFVDTQLDIVNVKGYLRDIDTETRSQPFVLAQIHDEASKLQPSSIFVVVEKQVMPQPTLLKAVDICYKTHYVFDCKYQQGCKDVWSFLETSVYNQTPSEKESPTLRALRAFMSFKNTIN